MTSNFKVSAIRLLCMETRGRRQARLMKGSGLTDVHRCACRSQGHG